MKPQILLRSASVLALIHAALHTFGGLLSAPSHGQEEVTLLTAMKSFHMDVMGSLRTYWDFYFGFGLFLTVSLVVLAVFLWQLAALAKTEPTKARPFIGTLCAAFVAFVILSWCYFFVAPLVTEAVIAILIGLAYASSRQAAQPVIPPDAVL
jgi:hypothetical protein